MITVRLSTSTPGFPWFRQTPDNSGVWGGCRFVIDEPIKACDFWVVIDGIPDSQVCRCPPQNTLFIASEPNSVKSYREGFLDQFAAIWTTHPDQRHKNAARRPPYLPWHIGIDWQSDDPAASAANFNAIETYLPVEKKRNLSVITSDKAFTPWHAKRITFVEQLKRHFDQRIDVYGRGIRDIGDKAEAILPYRYHVVLENSCFQDYWTEKLCDSFLGGAFPIYWGCPNADAYFPENSFAKIDMEDVDASIDTIENILRAEKYEKIIPDLLEARRRILYKYNIFQILSEYVLKQKFEKPMLSSLLPERYFRRKISVRRFVKKAVDRARF